jgi:hypothetical protein
LAAWVVVGKLARALAAPVTVTGAVHKAVGFVGKVVFLAAPAQDIVNTQ